MIGMISVLYPGNGKPLFEQLKDVIIQKITSGEYNPGECLPSERDLAQLYGVSRVTIRIALSDLVNDGILLKKHGKGTYVASKKIEHSLGSLIGVVEELEMQHLNTSVIIHEKSFCKVSSEKCKKMNLADESIMLKVVRHVMVDNKPFAIDYTYLPESIAYLLDGYDLSKDVIYRILEKYGYKITTAEQTISAENPTPNEAGIIGIKVSSPVLVLNRVTYVEGNIPILYNKTIYQADRYQYGLSLKRYPIGLDSIPG
jgi:GntR family transcriptional regulator